MARKTIAIGDLVARVNRMIAATPDELSESRTALGALLESVLMDTGNYHGFNYLPSEFLPAEEQTPGNVLRPGHDNTRRRYYTD